MPLYKRGHRWWIKYKHDGKTYRESVGRTKRLAEQALAIRRAEIAQGKFNIQSVKRSPTFEAFADDYLAWAADHHRGSADFARQRLQRLRPFFQGHPLNQITPWLIERYKQERRQQVSPATVNRDLAILSSFFSKAVEWGKLPLHPMRGGRVKKLPGEVSRERILTPEEESHLLEVSPPELADAIHLLLDTGMRIGELAHLTPADVDLTQGELHIRESKTGKPRRIPLTARARAILEARSQGLAPEAAIFPATQGQRCWRLKTAWQRAVERAGLPGLRFHDLRHTFATRLVTAMADLVTVKTLLGHSDLRMTSRYAHPTSASMRHALQILDAQARVPTKTPTVSVPREKRRQESA